MLLSGLRRRADEDLVERDAAGAADGEGDDLRDVLGGDRRGVVELLDALLRLVVGDVVGQLGRDRARLDDDDAHVGQSATAYPSAASARAVASPIPDEAPV